MVILVDPSGIVSGEVRLIKLATPITAYLKKIKYTIQSIVSEYFCHHVIMPSCYHFISYGNFFNIATYTLTDNIYRTDNYRPASQTKSLKLKLILITRIINKYSIVVDNLPFSWRWIAPPESPGRVPELTCLLDTVTEP